MMGVGRVDRDLRRSATGDVVARRILVHSDNGDRPSARLRYAHVLESSGCLELTSGDGVENIAHFALEHPAGNGIESDLGLIARADALKRILLESRSKGLIVR